MCECAVRRRAVDDLALHRLDERCFTASLDERQDAAAEARTHDAGAEAAFDPPRPLDQRVDVRRRDLEIVTQALMRFLEEHPQSLETALLEGFDEGMDAGDLRFDVPHSFWVAGLRFAAALVVRRVGTRTMLPGADDGDHHLAGEGPRSRFERGAAQQQPTART